jgi:hypothetical protein
MKAMKSVSNLENKWLLLSGKRQSSANQIFQLRSIKLRFLLIPVSGTAALYMETAQPNTSERNYKKANKLSFAFLFIYSFPYIHLVPVAGAVTAKSRK